MTNQNNDIELNSNKLKVKCILWFVHHMHFQISFILHELEKLAFSLNKMTQ